MSRPPSLAYGSWPSPITAAMVCEQATPLLEPAFDPDDGDVLYWIECRATEHGRQVLLRRSADGSPVEVLPAGFNTRTRVYEYGGRGYGVRGGVVVASDFSDDRLYVLPAGEKVPRPLTPSDEGFRYGAPVVDLGRGLVFCVRERPGDVEPVDELVAVRLDSDGTDAGTVVLTGPDFVSQQVISADGRHLAWVQWQHPNMPWDETELWVGELHHSGELRESRQVAGGPGECVSEPVWHPDGRLLFLSDRTGWANLYALELAGGPATTADPTALCPVDLEFGGPAWGLGHASYGVVRDRIVASWIEDGGGRMGLVAGGQAVAFATTATSYAELATSSRAVAAVCSYLDRPRELVVVTVSSPSAGTVETGTQLGATGTVDRVDTVTIAATSILEPDPGLISRPEHVTWDSADGATAYGFLYLPANSEVTGPADERPPLIVTVHGGPTSASPPAFSLVRTYWTSRGFAVLDVNYGGSTGYGRAYRDRLLGGWGVVDVADCSSGALAMADLGRADGSRLAVTGGSAGGFTALACLTATDTFSAGASHFGISDLAVLAEDTHKFESRYLDSLVGPYPERADLYRERSPIHHVDRLSCPIVLFQGTEDTVVPPNQAELMAAAVRAKGLPVSLVWMEGEGHGFRLAENQIRALETELVFYGKVFGFQPAGDLPDLHVENLD
jgi:dipeptidyl aminopeptidase/acylaminoacyl peptidase